MEFKSQKQNQAGKPKDALDTGKKPIPEEIEQCEAELMKIFGKSTDIVIQRFETHRAEALLLYVDGMVDKDLIDRDLLTPLKSDGFDGEVAYALKAPCRSAEDIDAMVSEVLSGNTALIYKGRKQAIIADFKKFDKRGVESPESEVVVRGPKEGFVENLRTNTAMLRRKIKTPRLIIESLVLGKQTNTIISLAYVEGIVNLDSLQMLRSRLEQVDTDAILESGYIEQFIEDKPFSLVSSFGLTQKPDVLAGRLLEGRIGIFCDGTPHVLTVPHLFIENLQTSEDYYNRTLIAIFMRAIRLFALFISLYLPGLFLAVTTYHQEMIPWVFLSTLISAIEKTPLPLGAEILFLTLMFELLRESGTRLPKAIGSAVSIVGALIIGEAAVNAGIVSAPTVIVVALTAVCSFIIPSLNEFMTIYRLLYILAGGMMGLIGIAGVSTIMLAQMVSTDSFGVAALSDVGKENMKDNPLRMPLWSMKYRPSPIVGKNRKRRK